MSDASNMYARLQRHMLTEQELFRYGYPLPDHAPGHARINTHPDTFWMAIPGPNKHFCNRCHKIYDVDKEGWPLVQETCKWHLQRPRGGVHPCCGRSQHVGHCQTSEFHVHCDIDPDNLKGFISTDRGSVQDRSVLAMDTEMVATTRGFEVAAISVVDHCSQVLYEAKVRPAGHIFNYNTAFSGITEADLRSVTTGLQDVQAKLLSLMGPRTILVGHGLHNDLVSLQLLHSHIVDTVKLYPHPKGWPARNSLSYLKRRHLPKVQEDGLKSREDAVATMMLARLKCGLRARV